MSNAAPSQSPEQTFADLSREELLVTVADLSKKLKLSEHQLDWFKRQLFGQKSEKRFLLNPEQMGFDADALGEISEEQDTRDEEEIKYTRKKGPKQRSANCVTDTGLRFDDSVPMKTIRLTPPEIEGLDDSEYEIIDVEKSYRLSAASRE